MLFHMSALLSWLSDTRYGTFGKMSQAGQGTVSSTGRQRPAFDSSHFRAAIHSQPASATVSPLSGVCTPARSSTATREGLEVVLAALIDMIDDPRLLHFAVALPAALAAAWTPQGERP
jgi:hypothetical protein